MIKKNRNDNNNNNTVKHDIYPPTFTVEENHRSRGRDVRNVAE